MVRPLHPTINHPVDATCANTRLAPLAALLQAGTASLTDAAGTDLDNLNRLNAGVGRAKALDDSGGCSSGHALATSAEQGGEGRFGTNPKIACPASGSAGKNGLPGPGQMRYP